MLEAQDISARRGDATLFTHLTLRAMPGQALVVTGPNGRGKTTLLRILVGLTLPFAGTLRWRGQSVAPHALALRRDAAVGEMLPQQGSKQGESGGVERGGRFIQDP
jgi:ABC-type transport system involved in cytochrome c biogenesis ATPase subunit